MAIAFNCPHCGHAFEVADSYAGQSGPCVACKQTMTVPGTLSAFSGSAAQDRPPQKGSSAGLIIGLVVGGFFVMIFCGGVLAALLLPALQRTRETARETVCLNNAKNIGLAFHNHHDVHRRMPLASSHPVSGIPGNGSDPNAAGYGWTVALLPFLEEFQLYDEISKQSQSFKVPPFDTSIAAMSCAEISVLVCPSNPSMGHVDIYASDYQEYIYQGFNESPAITNYMVTAASHLTNPRGPAELYDQYPEDDTVGNGMIPFPVSETPGINKGLSFRSVTDGTSKTLLFCESREQGYAAWMDGQATWVVGAWPENVEIPTETGAADGLLGWPDTDFTSITSLAAGRDAQFDPSAIYMEKTRMGTTMDRRFGPGSNHVDGLVHHTFVDGHVMPLSPDIDRNLYLRIISRDGAEPVPSDNNW